VKWLSEKSKDGLRRGVGEIGVVVRWSIYIGIYGAKCIGAHRKWRQSMGETCYSASQSAASIVTMGVSYRQ